MENLYEVAALTEDGNVICVCDLVAIKDNEEWYDGIVVQKEKTMLIAANKKITPIKIGTTIKLNESETKISHCF